VNKEPCFWDSSALVPLCVNQNTSRKAQLQLRKHSQVVWWGSSIEVTSAIVRLHKSGEISGVERAGAISRLELLLVKWKEIIPSDFVRELARRLLDNYDLRAADALQLSAALTWCRERPARRSFITADRRLSRGAAAAGFSVIDID
jgi:uncharacterized protein